MEQDIRQQIVDAARKIFAQYGFRKTTVDEIAASIHKAKSSIYHYFNSKEEIFKAVIKKEYDFFKQKVNEVLQKLESPMEKLRCYILTRLNMLLDLGNFYTALRNDYFECLGLIEELRKQYILDEIEIFENILQEGVDKGLFAVKNVKGTAKTIIRVLKSLEYSWGSEENKEELKANVSDTLDIFLYGVLKR